MTPKTNKNSPTGLIERLKAILACFQEAQGSCGCQHCKSYRKADALIKQYEAGNHNHSPDNMEALPEQLTPGL